MQLDENVVGAVERYFKWGLPPGSFTEYLLRGADDHMLVTLAHPHIKHLVSDHRWFVENCVPACCRNENFNTWHGYDHAIANDPELKLAIHLAIIPTSVARKWIDDVEADIKLRKPLDWEETDVLS